MDLLGIHRLQQSDEFEDLILEELQQLSEQSRLLAGVDQIDERIDEVEVELVALIHETQNIEDLSHEGFCLLWDGCGLALTSLLYSGCSHGPDEFHESAAEVNVELPPLLELEHFGAELEGDFVVEGGVGVGGEEEELALQGSDAVVLVEYSDTFLEYLLHQGVVAQLPCPYDEADQFQAFVHLHEFQYRLLAVSHRYPSLAEVLDDREALGCRLSIFGDLREVPYNYSIDLEIAWPLARRCELGENTV